MPAPISKAQAIIKLAALGYEMENPDKFKNTNTRMIIKCVKHSKTWESTSGEAYRGAKICDVCRFEKGDWRQIAHEKKYTILSEDGEYATFKCKDEHEWTTKCGNIKFTFCQICSGKKVSNEAVFEKIKSRGFELLNPDEISSTKDRGHFKCAKNHEWHAQVHNVYEEKSGCPHCSTTSGERRCRFILEAIFEKPFCKTRSVVIVDDQRLELDMYNEELQIACEYNGIQHYIYDPNFFHKHGGFEEQQERDEKKRQYCLDNGIHLIEVPYTCIKFKEYVDFIVDKLQFVPRIDWNQKEIEFNSLDDNNKMSSTAEVNEWTEAANSKGGQYIKSHSNGRRLVHMFTCANGHEFSLQPSDVRRGRWCYACSGRMALSDDTIKDQLAAVGMDLVSKFVKSSEEITIKCNFCDSEYNTIWDNCKQRELKRGCRECASSSAKLEKMQAKLKELGLEFTDKLYVDAKTTHSYECKNGHITKANWNALKVRKNGCKECPKAA